MADTLTDVTMLDVARRAGVGIGTVSRVVNDAQSVSRETAEAVRKIIAEVGYTPPTVGRKRPRRSGNGSFARESNVVLLILGELGLRWIMDYAPVYSYVIDGIEQAVSARRGSLTIRQIREPHNFDFSTIDKASGIILFGEGEDVLANAPLTLKQIPVVKVMGSLRLLPYDSVQPDHSRLGSLAAEYFLSQGHESCAYIGSRLGSFGFQAGYRADAFSWTLERAGHLATLLLDGNIVHSSPVNAPDEQVIGRLLDQLVELNPRPTALMVEADMLTPSIYRQLLARGVRPQEDLTIVTCNNEAPYLISLHPKPVVIDLQGQMIGHLAVEQLFWRSTNQGMPRLRLQVEPKLIVPKDMTRRTPVS